MRRSGWLFGVGGLVWAVTAIAGLDAADGSGGFYVAESAFIVAHLLVLVGLVALARSTAPTAAWGRNGLRLAVVGRAAFVVAEVAAIAAGKDELPFFPPAVVMTAAGMVIGGVAIIQAGVWTGWRRWAPLAMGVFPLIAIVPAFAVTGDRPNTSVVIWGLVQAAVGLAMATEEPEARRATAFAVSS